MPYLEPAEGVFLCELHGSDVVVKVAFARAPEGLQLVPLGQDGVPLISQQCRGREGAGCVDELVGLSGCLGRLVEQPAA